MMINGYVFVISLIVGLLISRITTPGQRVIFVHPTPDNTGDYLFRDKAGTCFAVVPTEVACTAQSLDYPVQV
jgi:hypothetical protein